MANRIQKYIDEAYKKFDPTFDREELPELDFPEAESDDIGKPYILDNLHQIPVQSIQEWYEANSWQENGSLDQDDRNLLDGGLRHIGFEVYAFYKSFRQTSQYPFPDQWGIFYFQHGIERMMELIESYYPSHGTRKIAHEFLRQHEIFHFNFDIYALSIESITGIPRYEPLKYIFRKYPCMQTEEALANRQVWQWSRKRNIKLSEFTYEFMKLQPGAYSRFDENEQNLRSQLAANLHNLDVTTKARLDDRSYWVANIPSSFTDRTLCPEYFIPFTPLSRLISPALTIPDIRKINDSDQVKRSLKNSKHPVNRVHPAKIGL